MYGGDRSRKINWWKYGLRLPQLFDNSLKICRGKEWEIKTISLSATPAENTNERVGSNCGGAIDSPDWIVEPIIGSAFQLECRWWLMGKKLSTPFWKGRVDHACETNITKRNGRRVDENTLAWKQEFVVDYIHAVGCRPLWACLKS